MPTSADRYAADTSVAVAALDGGHTAHAACRAAIASRRPALAGHAAFETYSVLTRMPGQLAVDGPTAARLLAHAFPESCWLTKSDARALLDRCSSVGITGGAVYDALVGEARRPSAADTRPAHVRPPRRRLRAGRPDGSLRARHLSTPSTRAGRRR
ncbi:MAG: hypothetical protein QM733_18145 [Ilumatobacteraceae bacterium]